MKLLSLLIVLVALFLIGYNWAGFWHNLTTDDYNRYACQATGKTIETCGKGTAKIFGWEVSFK